MKDAPLQTALSACNLSRPHKRPFSGLRNLVHRICHIGTDGVEDEVLADNIIMTNTLSLAIGTAIFFIAPVVYLLTGKLSILLSIIIEFALNASVLLINYYRGRIAASLTLFLLQCVAISYYCFLLGGLIQQLQFMMMFLISIICLIFSEAALRRLCFIAAGLTLALVQAGYYYNFFVPIAVPRSAGFIIQSLAIGGVLFIIAVVSRPYIRANDLKYQLIRANHFKRLFIAEVSHELRTPLNTIYLSAQLIKRDMKLNAALREIEPLVDQQLYACESARGIIGNVLSLAEIEAGKTAGADLQTGNPGEFFRRLVEGSKVISGIRGLRLDLQQEGMPEAIVCDWQQLHQVATNLLANAIKYSPASSTVRVRVTAGQGHWQLAIGNKGTIPSEKLAVIFDPFERGSARGKEGSGLGLFIVASKVRVMGGRITATSSGGDTVFTLTLPLVEGRPEDLPVEPGEVQQLTHIDILLAEDNSMNALLLEKFLSQNDCQVTVTANGRELLEEMERCAGQGRLPDVILLDHQMPELDGMQTLARLKADVRFRDLPVVFATGEGPEGIRLIRAAGAAEVLTKPIAQGPLLQAISRHVRRSSELLGDLS